MLRRIATLTLLGIVATTAPAEAQALLPPGDPAPTFTPNVAWTAPKGQGRLQQTLVGKVDGDAADDVVLLDGRSRIQVLRPGLPGAAPVVSAPFGRVYLGPLALGDVDGDGRADLAVSDGRSLLVAYGDGQGRFAKAAVLGKVPSADGVAPPVVTADVDGDGADDLLAAGGVDFERRPAKGAGVLLVRGRKDRSSSAIERPTPLRTAQEILASDLDGDGLADLVVDGQLLRATGGGRFAAPVLLATAQQDERDREAGTYVPSRHVIRGRDVIGYFTKGREGPAAVAVSVRDGQPVAKPVTTEVSAPGAAFCCVTDLALLGDKVLLMPDLGPNGFAVWSTEMAPDGRTTAPVPVLPLAYAEEILPADVNADGQPDLVVTTDDGTVTVWQGGTSAPIARLQISERVPVFPGVAPLLVELTCGPGAGGCVGELPIVSGREPLRLQPGERRVLRLGPGRRVPGAITLRWRSALQPTSTRAQLVKPSRADIVAACARGRLAAAPTFTVVRVDGFQPLTCERRTGRLRAAATEPGNEAIDPAAGIWRDTVALVDDVCPGGFEGCWAGFAVYRYPSGNQVSGATWGGSGGVASITPGRGGAFAFVACDQIAGESPYCLPGDAGPYTVWRVDGRGFKVLARGRTVRPASLRTLPGGRRFSYSVGGSRRTAAWRGKP